MCWVGNYIKKTRITVITAVLLMVFSVLAFSPSTHATEAMTVTISSNTLGLNLAPNTAEGTFGKGDLNIDVSLAVRGGYNLTITGSDNVGNLIGSNDSSHIISSISSAVTEENFSASANTQYNNKWGYKVEKNSVANNTYQPAPTTTTSTLDTVSNFTGTNNYVLSLGARANTATPIDSYKASFTIAVVSTITCNNSATTIGTAICMQDINDNVINSMATGTQYQLMDNRDNKVYYIAKMQDGRVWMTQNLDLDLETTPNKVAALTHANTDLGWTTNDTSATWTPGAATVTTAAGWGTNTNTAPVSYDPGDVYYYYDKTANTTTTYDNATTATADCNAAHNDGTCDHYHVGNYYNWSAAVASNNTNSINTSNTAASDSICPAGWRLPAGRTSTTTGDPGYYSEINYTWVAEELGRDFVTGTSSAVYLPDSTNGWKNIRSSNMYMVAAGYKNGENAPTQTTTYGRYWTSSNASSTSYAYAPYFYSSGLYPSYSNSTYTVRGRGMSVRCVARQSNTGKTVITYDSNSNNEATGTTASQEITAGNLGAVSANGYTRTGYTFVAWNTKADGTGTSYSTTGTNKYYPALTGTETTNVTLYAQWALNKTITFNSNAPSGTTATGTMNNQTINGNSSANLTQNAYAVTGYAFNSWNTAADGSGTRYTDKQSYNVPANNTEATVTLYAQWDKLYTVTFAIGTGATSIAFGDTSGMNEYENGDTVQAIEGKAYTIGGNFPIKYGFNTWTTTANGTLGDSTAASTTYTVTGDATLTLTGQEATTSITSVSASGTTPGSTCKNTTPVRNVQLVYDPRDNEAYWVGELCDGKVWMLDNLRLDLSNSTTLNGLSTTNTNASAKALECLKTGTYGGNACTSPYATAAVVNKTSGFSSYNLPYVNVNYKDNIAPVTYGVGSGKIGVYYNYCATSAGSYCYANGAGVDVADTYRDIESDICPAGWRLPSGNTNSGTRITDYGTLYSAYASATIGQGVATRNALSTPLSGNFGSSSQNDLGAYGTFWSSTWYNTNSMYNLDSSSTGAVPDYPYSRYYGQSIRCVLGSP